MKVIHCADLHLDSKMNTHFDTETASKRRAELLVTFVRMVEYAAANGVEAVLIAGDLFDKNPRRGTAVNTVLEVIRAHPDIRFYYLRGNHDPGLLCDGEERPGNLFTFGDTWNFYREHEGQIVIAGVEDYSSNYADAEASCRDGCCAGDVPVFDSECINIVMLHGQTGTYSSETSDIICLKDFKGRNIDYLALGHIHAYTEGELDARGSWCYPGCLEGRGFDECGEHGFVLLDIDVERHTVSREFVPFSGRHMHLVQADVSSAMTSIEAYDSVCIAIKDLGASEADMLKVVLQGEISPEAELDDELIRGLLFEKFSYVKVLNETEIRAKADDYRYDESLKGEFVRLVMESTDISEADKGRIIAYGLKALRGEEVLV